MSGPLPLSWQAVPVRVAAYLSSARKAYLRSKTLAAERLAPIVHWLLSRLTKCRRTCAVVFSIALHLLFILFLIPRVSPGGLTGGGGIGDGSAEGDGTAVEMFDGRLPQHTSLKVKEPDPEDGEELTTTTLTTTSDLALTDTLVTDLPQPLMDVTPDVPVPQTTSAADNAAHMGATGTGGLTSGDGDDLWAAIAPCWRRMADDTTLAVTLEVTFTADGALAVPPVIDRLPGTAQDSRVLISESRAIQALAACGAYPMAGGRENVKIQFPRM